jgi:hypothetical protein
VRYLRFYTGGSADRIEVDAATTRLQAAFAPLEYDALAATQLSLRAQLSIVHGAAHIILDAPRQVRRVRLAAAATAPGRRLAFHRLDGSALSQQATTTAGFAYRSLALERQATRLPTRAAAAQSLSANAVATGAMAAAAALGDTATLEEDFTDARLAVRLVEDAAGVPLSAADVKALHVRSYPAGPRLGLAGRAAVEQETPAFFWRLPGEIGRDAATAGQSGVVQDGIAFAEALQRHLDGVMASDAERLAAGGIGALPLHVDVALLAESDAPCLLDVAALGVDYHLVIESFPDRQEKRVLRFAGGAPDTHTVTLQRPGTARVT